jgi:hypothetical protein
MGVIKEHTETFKGKITNPSSDLINIEQKLDSVTNVVSLTNHVNNFLKPLEGETVMVKITIKVETIK